MLDFIAIGLGPFNLSLTSLLHEKTELHYLFFEKKAQFDWHAGMQLPNTVLQVPFMADLVSMVDPTSPLSFLNYLKSQQRLYKFYFLEQPHIPRREYNHYCQWVADQLGHIQYQSTVKAIYAKNEGFEVVVEQGGRFIRYLCRNLVIGSGNQPYLPECLRKLQQVPEKCIHSADYLTHKKDKLKGNVVVLGSGQSSAEVFLDLFDQQYQHDHVPTADFKLHWLTRSNGFFPMEYAPLGLEHFSPNYTQHFYRLSETQKAAQLRDQGLLYKGISAKTIREIYQKLYHRSIASATQATHLHAQIQLLDAELLESQQIRLSLEHTVTKQRFYMDVDFVVASTGYYSSEISFLKYLKPLIATDQAGRWQVSQDYRLQHTAMGEIYVQNQEMHSHGVGTPDLGLGAFRAATIANQLLGYQLYELDSNEQTFQHFSAEQNPEMYVQNDTSITRTAALAPSIPKSKNIEQRKIQTGSHPSMQPYTFEKII